MSRLGIAGLFGLIVGHHLLLEPGVVSLIHDWAIPPFGAQNIELARETYDGWYKWAMGSPVTYPTEYPLQFLLAGLSWLGVGGDAMSKAVIVVVPALAFLSAAALGRRLGLGTVPSFIAGAFYALCPVMFNKLVSGQLAYLVGYAALPCALATYLSGVADRLWPRAALVLAVALGLSSIEVQLGVIACGLVIVLACIDYETNPYVRTRLLAGGFFLLLVIESPTILGLAHGAGTLSGNVQFIRSLSWLDVNSVAPSDGLRLVGYLTRYFEQSAAGLSFAWIVASWAVVGFVGLGIVFASPRIRSLCLLAGVPALIFAAGVKGVLSRQIVWFFSNVSAAEAFRELYHIMVVPALMYSLALGSLYLWLGRFRAQAVFRGLLIAVTALYVAPIFSGDVGGWLHAYPIDRNLREAFERFDAGYDRIAWFPIDQPLSFQGQGAGVDPLAVTDRGSLWNYTLGWPMTAVNMFVRADDGERLRGALRLLSVSDVIERYDFRSRLMSFAFGYKSRYYDDSLHLSEELGRPSRETGAYASYKIADPWPEAFASDELAVAPRRMGLLGKLARAHLVPVSFGLPLPRGIPFVVVTDQGDSPEEAVSGIPVPALPPYNTVDARESFAPLSAWAWYRPCYADAPAGLLAIGPQEYDVPVTHGYQHGVLVAAWIATPVGGRVRISMGKLARVIDTYSPSDRWESAAIPLGGVERGAVLKIQSLDPGAEVALRAIRTMALEQYQQAVLAYHGLLDHAAHVFAPVERIGSYAPVRRGHGTRLGLLSPRYRYRLTIKYVGRARSFARVQDSLGYPIASVRLAPAQHGVAIMSFDGERGQWRLAASNGALLGGWELERAPRTSTNLGLPDEPAHAGTLGRTAATFPSGHRILVLNVTYNSAWRLDGGINFEHLPTALGMNTWLLASRPTSTVHARYALSDLLHACYLAGSLVMIFGGAVWMHAQASAMVRSVNAERQIDHVRQPSES